MLSLEQLDGYRRVTPSERLAQPLRKAHEEVQRIRRGTTEDIDAFLARINRSHDEASSALVDGLRRAHPAREGK